MRTGAPLQSILLRRIARVLALLCLCATPASAATLSFTVTASEPVTVTGTPRIAIDVGGATRYASYAAGSGTAALTFTYAVQSGDFDANGIAIASPLELNGGTIVDLAGNPAGLTFTLPDTSAIKVQTYTAAFTTSPITNSNATAVSFAISRAPVGASFTYSITSSGGSGSVTGSGTIAASTHSVSGVDVSALPSGTLTLLVTLSTPAAGTGAARTATAPPSFTGVLDGLPSAIAAFSVRRLAASYAGPLLRVRRASDNAGQDIGATVSGDIDIAALASFCGASSCFVSTFYDQSGSGTDVVQATTTKQPRIFSGSAIERDGARPTVNFTAFGQVLVAPPLPGQSVEGAVNAVAHASDTAINRHVLGNRGTSNVGRILRAVAGGGSWFGANISGSLVNMPGSTTQQRVVTLASSSSGVSGSLDGAVTAGTTTSAYFNSTWDFWIGGTGGGASNGDWVGTISEATVFNVTLTTAQRQTLERDQGSYYGITVQ